MYNYENVIFITEKKTRTVAVLIDCNLSYLKF